MHTKSCEFMIKAADAAGHCKGYASVFGNIDGDGEVLDKGAFKKSITQSRGVVPVLWQHKRDEPAGWGISAREDDHGLAVEFDLLIDTEKGRYAHAFVQKALEVGGRAGLSIGFQVPQTGAYLKDGVRHFSEVTLREYSIVTFPSNDLAVVSSAKGFSDAELRNMDGVLDLLAITSKLSRELSVHKG